jgi:hypothetical protein
MAKERNPNFVYVYSEVFGQEYAISKKTGDVTFADGTKYSSKEIDILVESGMQLTLAEHRIKKIIGGEIVGFTKTGAGADNKGKPVESGSAKNIDNAKNPSGEVAAPPKDGAGTESDELDIY